MRALRYNQSVQLEIRKIRVTDDHGWLTKTLPLHERLAAAASSLLESILRKNSVEYLGVTSRTKSLDGALEKIRRKQYARPKEQLTDLSGIRIVTFLETQAMQIAEIVKELFEVDHANSHDRSADLGEDKIGYRSTHFVCTLGKTREALPEYEGVGSLKFEIQIRTVLQHAWAELAHDRSFKFGQSLPTKIQRKLNLYSGLLEIVDGSFDEIAREIHEYKKGLEGQTISQISAVELNSISLERFTSEVAKELHVRIEENADSKLLDEAKEYGLKNIGDVEALATQDFKKQFKKHVKKTTTYGLLRDLMMFNDMNAYFRLGKKFGGIDRGTLALLATKYRHEEIHDWLDSLGIAVL